MKRLIFLAPFCVLILIFLTYRFVITPLLTEFDRPAGPPPRPTQIIQEEPMPIVSYEGQDYSYMFFSVDDVRMLTLHANYDSMKRAGQLVHDYQCRFAANGGFYTTDNKPLGAVVTTDYHQPTQLTSTLFNGFLLIYDTRAIISGTFDQAATTILQSGPRLADHGMYLTLSIQNDEHARRTVVATTDAGQLFFFTFYIHDSIYNGPLLAHLPEILRLAASKQHIQIADALNLDGGSASYFKNTSVELPELTPIGSIFCLQ